MSCATTHVLPEIAQEKVRDTKCRVTIEDIVEAIGFAVRDIEYVPIFAHYYYHYHHHRSSSPICFNFRSW
jgi:hypothetical protein